MDKWNELVRKWERRSIFSSARYRTLIAVILLLGLGGTTSGIAFAAPDRIPLLVAPVTTDLGQHMIDQIDNRIAGFSTSQSGFRSLWTTRGNTTGGWQYNTTTLWSNQGAYALDFTGTSPWSSTNSAAPYAYGATLISPRHVLLAEHVYHGANVGYGATFVFVDQNNQVITRTLLNRVKIGSTDINIGVLDADVPSSIPYYPLISYDDLLRYVSSVNIPIIRLDQYDNVLIQDIGAGYLTSTGIGERASTGIRAPYTSSAAISGDSGNPNFAVIGDQLVLLGAQFAPTGFPNTGNYISEINAAMATLGGGYQVKQLELSHFTPYNPPSIPNQTMNVVEQSAKGTVVGTVQVNGADNPVNPLTNFNITAGNPGTIFFDGPAFSIDSITGVISVNQPSDVDFSKIQTVILTVSAQDSSVFARTVTGTVSISVTFNPNITHPIISAPGFYVWTEQTSSGSRQWFKISSSADGKELAAIESPGYVWTSADFGATWTQQNAAGSRNWSSISISSDGSHLIALDGSFNGTAWTAISSDAGATWNWTERNNVGVHNWSAAASSADGTKLAIVANDGAILTSSDAGATWTEHAIPGVSYEWATITSSADGARLAIGGNVFNSGVNSAIFTSTDSGTSWTSRLTLDRALYSLATSADGVKLVAGTDVDANLSAPSIYTSSDSGATWTAQTGSGVNFWMQVASSADSTRLGAVDGIYLWISKDSGLTWNRDENLPQNAFAIAFSADGNMPAAAIYGGNIWTAANGLTPSITTSNPSTVFSNSATLNGFVDDPGVSSVTTRGFQYGNTTDFGATTSESGAFDSGPFSASISGLTCGTTYYLRAYASNAGGTTFGRAVAFVPQCPAILTYNYADTQGSITGVNPQLVEIGQNGTAVTAIAATGYSFVNWSDGSTANPRTDTNVTASLSVTANFAVITPPPTPTPTDADSGDVPLPPWATALLFLSLLLATVRTKRTSDLPYCAFHKS